VDGCGRWRLVWLAEECSRVVAGVAGGEATTDKTKGWECFSSQPFGFNLAVKGVIAFSGSATGAAAGDQL